MEEIIKLRVRNSAIEVYPKGKPLDLAILHEMRAAAAEQMDDIVAAIADCDAAINLNNKYVKALYRRAKCLRKQAMKNEDFAYQVKCLECLEDITSVCVLEVFPEEEHYVMVDSVIKELGRSEAGLASKSRKPMMKSHHFVEQYFTSFSEDPILKSIEKESEGDVDKKEKDGDTTSGYVAAREALKCKEYEKIISHCNEEIEAGGDRQHEAKLLRATFYILTKQEEAGRHGEVKISSMTRS